MRQRRRRHEVQEAPAVFAIDYTCCRDAHLLAHPPTPDLIHDPVASVLCIWRTRSCVYGVPVGLIHAIQCGVGLSLLTSMFRVQRFIRAYQLACLEFFRSSFTEKTSHLSFGIRSVFCCHESWTQRSQRKNLLKGGISRGCFA